MSDRRTTVKDGFNFAIGGFIATAVVGGVICLADRVVTGMKKTFKRHTDV